ncbi:site-2 protease family protein [Lentisphaerota bacterium ZTH]|nr:site-2 protease family protein [Lentisphaerota bacterium]WET07208.1 site-2 protease family protein [Lentisphaerota bacterium ZTH]
MEIILQTLKLVGSIAFMVFFLGFCVFIHELGHFLAAKWRGMHIIAFSLGFKKAWGKKINGIEYRIGWLPFGGYVDIPQIDTTGTPKDENDKELPRAKPLDRIICAFAGPLFNIIFGLALGTIVWLVGIPQDSPKMRSIEVASIEKSSPEYKAGLRVNDKIVKINDKSFFCTWNDFVQKILFTVGKVKMDVERNGKDIKLAYTPVENPNAPKGLKFEKLAWPFFEPRIPLVMYPESGEPAALAGVRRGDILESINGKKVTDPYMFAYIVDLAEGKPLTLKVRRDGKDVVIDNIKAVPRKFADPKLQKLAENNYKIGINYAVDMPIKVAFVVPELPAAKAGIQVNDVIEKINGRDIKSAAGFIKELKGLKDKPFTLAVKRNDKLMNIQMAAKQIRSFDLGVMLVVLDHPTPWQQFVKVLDLSYKSLRGLVYWAAKKVGLTEEGSTIKFRNLSGPIGMGRTIFISVYYGSIMIGINFVVIISFALAIFNLLPLPVLDGGHILIALLEIIFRRPLHEGAVRAVSVIFVVLLISLMIGVTYNDILRWISQKKVLEQSTVEKNKPAKPEVKNVPATPLQTNKAE